MSFQGNHDIKFSGSGSYIAMSIYFYSPDYHAIIILNSIAGSLVNYYLDANTRAERVHIDESLNVFGGSSMDKVVRSYNLGKIWPINENIITLNVDNSGTRVFIGGSFTTYKTMFGMLNVDTDKAYLIEANTWAYIAERINVFEDNTNVYAYACITGT